jgi:hypothetical protein
MKSKDALLTYLEALLGICLEVLRVTRIVHSQDS